VQTVLDLELARDWFTGRYKRSAVLCAAGLAVWLLLSLRPRSGSRVAPVIGALVLGDLLLFGQGKRALEDPSLYYPPIPALNAVADTGSDRVLGIDCLPANFAQAAGLRDIRGFDSIDPDRWLDLLWLGSARRTPDFAYAAVQQFSPMWKLMPPDSVRFPAVLDMLAVRHAIFRGTPPAGVFPRFQSHDYYVLENRVALARASIPARVEVVADDAQLLRILGSDGFAPREVAYVPTPVALPPDIRGAASIREDLPAHVVVEAAMETPGLLLLADNWDPGWRARVDGVPAPLLRTNHSLRGVVVPAGRSVVEFDYGSTKARLGHWLALLALLALAAEVAIPFASRRARRQPRTLDGKSASDVG
jgi:hypothetical protein